LVSKAAQGVIHGVIAHLAVDTEALLHGLSVPVVNVSGRPDPDMWATVTSDDQRIGQLAATHFLDRGYRRYAYASIPEHRYSRIRYQAFRRALETHGHEIVELHQAQQPDGSVESVVDWSRRAAVQLSKLGRPLAVFACNDGRALQLSRALNDLGVQQPEDVAIMGVDNDSITCRLAQPRLSSVRIDAPRIGYEAAARLDAMMVGRPTDPGPTLIPPLGIEERLSSNAIAVEDDTLSGILRWIREHVHEGINVQDVLTHHGVSRRWLEVACHKHIGRSPLEEIRRARLDLAKHLLIETDLLMSDIAARAGFSDAKTLSMAFRKHLHQSPSEIRNTHRRKVSPP
jgi:LacI family transcriptional regulator